MTLADFTAWSRATDSHAPSVLPPPDEGDYIRELGGIEKFLSRKIPGTDKLCITFGSVYVLDGAVSHDALLDAVERVMTRHPMLRCYPKTSPKDGKEYWCHCAQECIPQNMNSAVQTEQVPDKEFEQHCHRELERSLNEGMFPEHGPQWWMRNIVSTSEERSCWVFCFNHGINDQKATNLMVTELLDAISSNAPFKGLNPFNAVISKSITDDIKFNNGQKETQVENHPETFNKMEMEMTANAFKNIDNKPKIDLASPFPRSLESALHCGMSLDSLGEWEKLQSQDHYENEASRVPDKIRQNYAKHPDIFAHYGNPLTRKAFVDLIQLSEEDTARLVLKCRLKGVTVTSVLSAAVLLVTSVFLQNKGGDKGEEEEGEGEERDREGAKKDDLNFRERRQENQLEGTLDIVDVENISVKQDEMKRKDEERGKKGGEKEKEADKEEVEGVGSQILKFYLAVDSRPYGHPAQTDGSYTSTLKSQRGTGPLSDWTDNGIVCASHVIDFAVYVPSSTVQYVKDFLSKNTSSALLDDREKDGKGEREGDRDRGESVEDLCCSDDEDVTEKKHFWNREFWILSKFCRDKSKEKTEFYFIENVQYIQYLVLHTDMIKEIDAECISPTLMGRDSPCAVSNVGVWDYSEDGVCGEPLALRPSLRGDRDVEIPLSCTDHFPNAAQIKPVSAWKISVTAVYFAAGPAYTGSTACAYSMTVKGRLCVCLSFATPFMTAEDGHLFKDTFLNLIAHVI